MTKSQILTLFLTWSDNLFWLALLQCQTESCVGSPGRAVTLIGRYTLVDIVEGMSWLERGPAGAAQCYSLRNVQSAWENPALWGVKHLLLVLTARTAQLFDSPEGSLVGLTNKSLSRAYLNACWKSVQGGCFLAIWHFLLATRLHLNSLNSRFTNGLCT